MNARLFILAAASVVAAWPSHALATEQTRAKALACFARACEHHLPLVDQACARACVREVNILANRADRVPEDALDDHVRRMNDDRHALVSAGPVPEPRAPDCDIGMVRSRCQAQGRTLCDEEALQFCQQLGAEAAQKAQARNELRNRLLMFVGKDGRLMVPPPTKQ